MRAAISSVPPLATMIRESTGLSTSAVGWLATIPLIGFAIFSPLAPAFARKFGIERTLAACLLIMTARANVGTAESGHRRTNVWTSGLAWQIMLFMGLQSFNFYIAVAWLPDMLISKRFTSEQDPG